MNTRQLFNHFNVATDTLSNQVRYVNYGLIAVLWILSGNAISGLKMEGNDVILFFVVLSLFLDICQYIWKSVSIWIYVRGLEKVEDETGKKKDDYKFPPYISSWTWVFFITKVVSCLVACYLLAKRLI